MQNKQIQLWVLEMKNKKKVVILVEIAFVTMLFCTLYALKVIMLTLQMQQEGVISFKEFFYFNSKIIADTAIILGIGILFHRLLEEYKKDKEEKHKEIIKILKNNTKKGETTK